MKKLILKKRNTIKKSLNNSINKVNFRKHYFLKPILRNCCLIRKLKNYQNSIIAKPYKLSMLAKRAKQRSLLKTLAPLKSKNWPTNLKLALKMAKL